MTAVLRFRIMIPIAISLLDWLLVNKLVDEYLITIFAVLMLAIIYGWRRRLFYHMNMASTTGVR